MNTYFPCLPVFTEAVECIILLRHFESIKNAKQIHGGIGDVLTTHGKEQLSIVEERLALHCINPDTTQIYHSASVQTRETARLISNKFKVPLTETLLLKSVDLGRLNGISDIEAEKNFPDDSRLMRQWRNREIEIEALTAIGMEHPKIFWDRGVEFLTCLSNKNNIIICSTSVMILLIHILCHRTYLHGNGYFHIPIKNAQIAAFNITDNIVLLDRNITDEGIIKYC